MTVINHTRIPEGSQIFKGPRGSDYIIRNGCKVYIRYGQDEQFASAKHGWRKPRSTPRARHTPKRGAYLRFIENQAQAKDLPPDPLNSPTSAFNTISSN